MRLTNRMITTKYISSFSDLSYNLDKLNTKVSSGREFMKASENPSAAIQAFHIRRELSGITGYQSNLAHAQGMLTNAESTLTHIQNGIITEAKAQILSGINGTQSADERKIVATELRNLQHQLLQSLNSSASGTYYFGGTNSNKMPFTVDDAGNLCYNEFNLNRDFSALDPAILDQLTALKSSSMYVDIGMGIKYDATGNVEPSTVFEYSVAGINITGSGMTADSDGNMMSNNLYNLLGQLADSLEAEDFDYDKTNQLFGHFEKQSISVLNRLTDVGAKTSYLDFMKDRYDTQDLNLEERQLAVEGADPAKTIVEFKSLKASYEAALQMGTYLIQPSIFNYMN